MIYDSISLIEGSAIVNCTVATGTAYPSSPNAGELFFRTDSPNVGLYAHNGTAWVSAGSGGGAGTVTSVAATAPAAGITISGSPITGSGTLTFALANDLAALEALSGTGFAKRTGTDTWTLDTSTYLTSNQTVTVSGDATGSGTTAITLTLATVATAGTYKSVTVNTKGLITAGTNPTTLAGYGITDAVSSSVISPMSGTFGTTFISQVPLDTYPIATYRVAEYLIQVTRGSLYHVTKVILMHDGTNATMTEYGQMFTTELGTFAADVSGSNARLLFTATSASATTINFVRITVIV
jgi:hypothetical protein